MSLAILLSVVVVGRRLITTLLNFSSDDGRFHTLNKLLWDHKVNRLRWGAVTLIHCSK